MLTISITVATYNSQSFKHHGKEEFGAFRMDLLILEVVNLS